MKNSNCDNDKCINAISEVRVLPLNKNHSSNLILCQSCFFHEIAWRKERNKELSKDCQFDIPNWNDLKIYEVKS